MTLAKTSAPRNPAREARILTDNVSGTERWQPAGSANQPTHCFSSVDVTGEPHISELREEFRLIRDQRVERANEEDSTSQADR